MADELDDEAGGGKKSKTLLIVVAINAVILLGGGIFFIVSSSSENANAVTARCRGPSSRWIPSLSICSNLAVIGTSR